MYLCDWPAHKTQVFILYMKTTAYGSKIGQLRSFVSAKHLCLCYLVGHSLDTNGTAPKRAQKGGATGQNHHPSSIYDFSSKSGKGFQSL